MRFTASRHQGIVHGIVLGKDYVIRFRASMELDRQGIGQVMGIHRIIGQTSMIGQTGDGQTSIIGQVMDRHP